MSCNGRRIAWTSVLLLLPLLSVPAPVSAQTYAPRVDLALVGGAWQYDLSGTGTTWFAGARAALPLGGPLLIEPGLTYARYTTQGGTASNLLFPEAQLQVELLRDRYRPFLGVGAGPAFISGGGSNTELSLTASAGLRAQITPLWGVRGELRVRSIDPWVGTAAEWTVGLSRRLGPDSRGLP